MSEHPRRTPRTTKSATVAIATATAFVLMAAILALFADDQRARYAGWTLRGAFVPDPLPPAVPKVTGRPGRADFA